MDSYVMVGFGYKMAWLAIPTDASDLVSTALELPAGRNVGWGDGVEAVYSDSHAVAVTPPIESDNGSEWVLAVGWPLLTVDIARLSQRLDREVQRFATHRVSEGHLWERATGRSITRSFEYVGETGLLTRWTGQPDAVELAIGLPALSEIVVPSELPLTLRVDEADVMRVAESWSLAPTALDGQTAAGPLTLHRPEAPPRRGRWWRPSRRKIRI